MQHACMCPWPLALPACGGLSFPTMLVLLRWVRGSGLFRDTPRCVAAEKTSSIQTICVFYKILFYTIFQP